MSINVYEQNNHGGAPEAEPTFVRTGEDVWPFARDVWLLVHRDLSKKTTVRAVMDLLSNVISENCNMPLR